MSPWNSYNDKAGAAAYVRLGFSDTYYLAYRDLPEIICNHVGGRRAVDFGCGSGPSTRFLQGLGFQVTGIDISVEMVDNSQQLDPEGDYRVVVDGDYTGLCASCYDLVLSVFTFDNIPAPERRAILLRNLGSLLKEEGRVVMLDSTPELYGRDWASFSTSQFPENQKPKSGDIVKTVIKGMAMTALWKMYSGPLETTWRSSKRLNGAP